MMDVERKRLAFCALMVMILMIAPVMGGTGDDYSGYIPAIRAYFDARFPQAIGSGYPIDLDVKEVAWLNENVQGAVLVQAYAKLKRPSETGTFILWNDRTYVMPDEFNTFMDDVEISIDTSEAALGPAELYVNAWEPSGVSGSMPVIVLSSIYDIPQYANPIDPTGLPVQTASQITQTATGYDVTLYTWSPAGGFLRQWRLSIDSNGKVTGSNILLDQFIGDCEIEGARPDRIPPVTVNDPSSEGGIPPSGPMGNGPDVRFAEQTRNVDIGGTTRFIIHWRPEDFVTGVSDGDVATVVDWVEAGARATWQRVIIDSGFNPPVDATIDIYIWNDTAAGSWGPEMPVAGYGPFCTPLRAGGNIYIYTIEHMIGWGRSRGYYWISEQDAHTTVIGHEFFHAEQIGYKTWDDDWVAEGSSRFLQTFLITSGDGEFWQNSNLAGLPPGPYTQASTHRSMYIADSMTNIATPDSSLKSKSYRACIYWRYVFEHYGGITAIRHVYDQFQSHDPSFDLTLQTHAINEALGTTDIGFSQYARANYLEFSPFAFARDNEFYQFSDRYYGNVNRAIQTWGLGVPSYTRSSTIQAYGAGYLDVIPGNLIQTMKITFNGDSNPYVVKTFRASGSAVTEQDIPLDASADGSITIGNTDSYNVIGIMAARPGINPGSYTITLERINTAPTAEANGPYNANIGQTITFNSAGSNDPDGMIASYDWDWGDGTAHGTGASPTHAYTTGGTKTVTLTVTDSDGAPGTDTATVNINAPPHAEANGPYNGNVGQTITFDSTSSNDPDGSIASYDWNWGDGTAHGTGASPTHAYTTSGTKTVILTVTDNLGATGTDTATANINAPPHAEANGPYNTIVGQTITFNSAGSTDPDGTIASYDWNWGDGTAHGTGASPTHAYSNSGAKTVTLTVTDDDGATGTDTASVNVNAPPHAEANGPYSASINQVISFSSAGSIDPDGSIVAWDWDWGDGTAHGTGPSPTHAYTSAGTKTVTLTVTDNGPAVATGTDMATVTIRTPCQDITIFKNTVKTMTLQPTIRTALNTRLNKASTLCAKGPVQYPAIATLFKKDFIPYVNSKTNKGITPAQATTLINQANIIIAACGG
jgi:PKD repeat protein